MRRFLIILGFMAISSQLLACDFCSYFQGINPTGRVNQAGLRYRFRSFSGEHGHQGGIPGHFHTPAEAEYYHTLEAWGRWYPIKRLMLVAQMPFSVSRENDALGGFQRIVGQGDLSIGAYAGLYETEDAARKVYHRIFAGGGVKFPTGRFEVREETGSLNPLAQPGTGSFDFFGGLNYLVKYKWIGLTLDGTYKYNLANRNKYRFADRINLNGNVFAAFRPGQWVLLPHTGLYYERAETDYFMEFEMANTGGDVVFSNIGMDVYRGRFAFQCTVQIPVWEKLNGIQGSNQFRLNTGLAYSWN